MKEYVRLIDLPEIIDSNKHEGFTVGKRGKMMFWYMLWSTTSNNCAIVNSVIPATRRYIDKDSMVILHYKEKTPDHKPDVL